MDEVKASPVVNPRMATLAKLLRMGRDIGNKATFSPSIPLVGGEGLGDLVLGKAPEEVENWGYGNMPVRMPEMSNIPMVKTGRKDGLADAMGLLPFSGGGAEKAMLTAMGNPKYLVSRNTYPESLQWAIRENLKRGRHGKPNSLLENTSFGVTHGDTIDGGFGDTILMPHPRSVDPKYHPENELYNNDVYTSGSGTSKYWNNAIGDKRFLFEDGDITPTYAIRIAASPRFKSFKEFEKSSSGAAALPTPGMYQGPRPLKTSEIALIDAINQHNSEWLFDPKIDPKVYVEVIRRNPQHVKTLADIRRSQIIGQSHAELKVANPLPLNRDHFQAVLAPKVDRGRLIEIFNGTGVPVIDKSFDDPVSQMIELQKKAKF